MVGVLTDGIVLMARVVSIRREKIALVRRRVHAALREVTGARVPARAGAWHRWLEENRTE